MCGIFGYFSTDKKNIYAARIIDSLYIFSETRGKEASGLISVNDEEIVYIKDAIPASQLIRRDDFKNQISRLSSKKDNTVAIIGHSRLVTNGESSFNENNQPIQAGQCVGVHNGIITNEAAIWAKYSELNKNYDIDSEVIFALLSENLKSNKLPLSIRNLYNDIEGVANIAVFFETLNIALLSTNNGSLYYVQSIDKKILVFASERYILEKVIQKSGSSDLLIKSNIKNIKANTYLVIDLEDMTPTKNEIGYQSTQPDLINLSKIRTVYNQSILSETKNPLQKSSELNLLLTQFKKYENIYERNRERIDSLRRCSKCLLPESMPFIEFDKDGVCNYCKQYKKQQIRGVEALKKEIPVQGKGFDCLVTLSGGRDSCFGLHYIKEELGLNPVTYTYDWGMVTDLARRNQMRLCGKLGVEHILVSADIRKKRNNIRKNVSAWLKKPNLGMIPLFMAGDKQYFYWANKIADQTETKTIILCENLLETTRFKSGFCGIKPLHATSNTYTLSIRNKLQMAFFYGMNFLKSPSYLNSSLVDTATAFSSYYVMDHNFLNLFDYIEWDENYINRTIIDNYNWETSPDCKSTWRIGDGTAAFYNYIYYTMAGLTENDTFRSNQIREGQITREEALQLSENENRPRFDSIVWYLDTISLDFEQTLDQINAAEKIYH
jgi:glutamine---fructose-6-phosphate transaminase (isomerizing)